LQGSWAKKFTSTFKEEGTLQSMASQRPDLNPIEKLWDIREKCVTSTDSPKRVERYQVGNVEKFSGKNAEVMACRGVLVR
jgi:hypothetical protein